MTQSSSITLVGLLIDVSGSMLSALGSESEARSRLESVESGLDKLVQSLAQKGEADTARLDEVFLFAYGFGFGGFGSLFSSRSFDDVMDLLRRGEESEHALSGRELVANWPAIKGHIRKMTMSALGSTPMVQAFEVAADRIDREARQRSYAAMNLLIISDGEPTDGPPDTVGSMADSLRRSGVLTISCFLTDADLKYPRRLRANPDPSWSAGAQLMFDCASEAQPRSPLLEYLRERHWEVEPSGRCLAQINHPDVLGEFTAASMVPFAGSTEERVSVFDFFIAHASADASEAEYLFDLLTSRNCCPYVDTRMLRLGDDWPRALVVAQGSSLVTVVLVSSRTDEAFYQQEEIARAIGRARANPEDHRVVPVYLDSSDPPYGLVVKHGIRAGGSLADVADRLAELIHTLR